MKNYKNLLSGSHYVRREIVSGSQLLLHYNGSNSQMNETVISVSHSNGTNFYKWVLWKIFENLLNGSHIVRRDVSGSQLLLYSSGSV
jgi:hypothetical protein